jgi:hypothetical protein
MTKKQLREVIRAVIQKENQPAPSKPKPDTGTETMPPPPKTKPNAPGQPVKPIHVPDKEPAKARVKNENIETRNKIINRLKNKR